MILSGEEIRRNLGKNIVIDPFDETRTSIPTATTSRCTTR